MFMTNCLLYLSQHTKQTTQNITNVYTPTTLIADHGIIGIFSKFIAKTLCYDVLSRTSIIVTILNL